MYKLTNKNLLIPNHTGTAKSNNVYHKAQKTMDWLGENQIYKRSTAIISNTLTTMLIQRTH